MPAADAYRVLRVKMWEMGHSFPEIDNMSLEDFGDILAYWEEKAAIEKKRAKTRENLSKSRRK